MKKLLQLLLGFKLHVLKKETLITLKDYFDIEVIKLLVWYFGIVI